MEVLSLTIKAGGAGEIRRCVVEVEGAAISVPLPCGPQTEGTASQQEELGGDGGVKGEALGGFHFHFHF